MTTLPPSHAPPVCFILKDVSFAYDSAPVLDGVSLSIDPGEFIGIVGPNGAGKTTLIRILSGMLAPDAGEALADGSTVARIDTRERARRIALVPQNETVAFPWSVHAMVLLGRHPHRSGLGFERREDFAAAREAMEAMRIEHLAERSVLDLSGGELHRVLIARALAQQTPVLLLDEPNAHLDLRHQVALFELLSRLHGLEGRTIVIITHDLNLAGMYCDRIVLMDDGRIVAFDVPERVLEEELLMQHFGVPVRVQPDPDTNRPMVRVRRTP
ncbi:MAG: ABC transporter ATP-binding protein [Bacteroidetes bacterium]|nr:ABC transporter ATP-binding protein [Bacteroidota bacterium]